MSFMNEHNPASGAARSLLGRLAIVTVALAGLAAGAGAAAASSAPYPDAAQKARIDRLIVYYAKRYNVPVALAREVVHDESEYRPLARNGPYWGLMQIRYDTAQGMGYRGPAKGLLDAETNLAFGIAYLSNAFKAAGGNMSRGHMLYRKGYYYEARRKRLLDDMILVRDFKPVGAEPTALAMADVEAATGALSSGQPKTASAAIAAAIAAPIPRAKPAIAVPETATVVASAAAAPAAAAPVGPAVAHPTVVYASVLPLSKPALSPANTLMPTPIVPPGLSAPEATADSGAGDTPIPRPKPAQAEADEVPMTPLQVALNAAAARARDDLAAASAVVPAPGFPVPRPRPDGTMAAIAPSLLVAEHVGAPVPRMRPSLGPVIRAE